MLLDMWETVHVKLYYDNRKIWYGLDGVDSAELNSIEKYIKRAAEWT
jgi:uncharacterized protein YprB with RNaseH-like and TPR domain